jgi:hypothetical protein
MSMLWQTSGVHWKEVVKKMQPELSPDLDANTRFVSFGSHHMPFVQGFLFEHISKIDVHARIATQQSDVFAREDTEQD